MARDGQPRAPGSRLGYMGQLARSQETQCSRYGRYVVDEGCALGCDGGRCLADNEVCGRTWEVEGEAILDNNSAICPLNGRILNTDWRTWKSIQQNPNITQNYLIVADSELGWFNRNMEGMFVTPNGSVSREVFGDSKPEELDRIQGECQAIYEKFACMRNFPECSDSGWNTRGSAENNACIQACKDVSLSCYAKFQLRCKDLQQSYKAQGLNTSDFQCVSLRELECGGKHCTKVPLGEGQSGLGWELKCEYMCLEFQRERSDDSDDAPRISIVLWVLALIFFIIGITFCCLCVPCCPGTW